MLLGVLVGIGVWSIVVTPAMVGDGVAQALPSTSEPRLTLNRLIRTSPFQSSASSLRDNEGSTYVARDNALWLASDNDNALFEVNRTTGALRRRIAQAAFMDARHVGGAAPVRRRTQDLEALAYNARADVLYAFSGSTTATPTAFRLIRDGNDRLQVQSWQPLPQESTGAGVAGGRPSPLCRGRIDHPNLCLHHEQVRARVLDPGTQWDLRPRLRRRDR